MVDLKHFVTPINKVVNHRPWQTEFALSIKTEIEKCVTHTDIVREIILSYPPKRDFIIEKQLPR